VGRCPALLLSAVSANVMVHLSRGTSEEFSDSSSEGDEQVHILLRERSERVLSPRQAKRLTPTPVSFVGSSLHSTSDHVTLLMGCEDVPRWTTAVAFVDAGENATPRCHSVDSDAFGSSDSALKRNPLDAEVTLHVYDIWELVGRSGLPIFHLGVEAYRREYYFSATGVQGCKPGAHRLYPHREAVPLGRTHLGVNEFKSLMQALRKEWTSSVYSVLGRNCQSFAVDVARQLGVAEIPWRYRCFSNFGKLLPEPVSFMACCGAPSRMHVRVAGKEDSVTHVVEMMWASGEQGPPPSGSSEPPEVPLLRQSNIL